MISGVRAQTAIVGLVAALVVVSGLLVLSLTGRVSLAPTASPQVQAVPTPVPCEMTDGTPITSAFEPFTNRWRDAVALADTTPRLNLNGPIGQLQAVRRDVQAVVWPPCARRAADLLIDGMNSEISGYLEFTVVPRTDDVKTIPSMGTVSYGYLVQVVGTDKADALFFADASAAIANGRQSIWEFGNELAYADGEQPRPE